MRRILSIAVLTGCIWFIANQAAKQTPPEEVEDSPIVGVYPVGEWLPLQPFDPANGGACANNYIVVSRGTITGAHSKYKQLFSLEIADGEITAGNSRQIYFFLPDKNGRRKFKMQLTAAEMKCLPAKQ